MRFMSSAVVRPAAEADVAAITAIYAHYVTHGAASFEIDPPDTAEINRRRLDIQSRGLPYLVAELDHAVAGYAYAAPYRPRLAYRFTVEDSIYIHPESTRQGVGSALMQPLIGLCTDGGYTQMIAVIGGSDNVASIRLHERFGFRLAGVLQSVGFKFGRWHDSILMQRAL